MSKKQNYKYKLYGAILGDLAGQPYEFNYSGDFSEFNLHDEKSKFTDDTLMTLAVAACLIGRYTDFESAYKAIGKKYQGDYYGEGFKKWLKTPHSTPRNSWANGCLMRVSPIMYVKQSFQEHNNMLLESVLPSHNHHESKMAVFELDDLYYGFIPFKWFYRLTRKLKRFTKFNISAKSTIKFIRYAFPTFKTTQEAIEKVVKCGGDTDTNASIIGELMNYHKQDLTKEDIEYVESKLDDFLLEILKEFNNKY